ncbi:MAG: hypothetical protein GKC10_01015 [Methanosarcinales archaeon]|nr:hypothetical protein [Methanosarcinales archaeon]
MKLQSAEVVDGIGLAEGRIQLRGGMMKALGMALALLLMASFASGYPLYGGNGDVNCTIYGAYKGSLNPGDSNYEKNMILYIDLGLYGQNSSRPRPAPARCILVDGNDRVYNANSELGRELQAGRTILGFTVPKEAIIKRLIIDPRVGGGERFTVDWDALPQASNDNATFTYYGVVGFRTETTRKYVSFDIGVTNNDSKVLTVHPSDFVLLDQWGWVYQCHEGFEPMELRSNQSMRNRLYFTEMSPLSRPVQLVFNSTTPLIIVLDDGLIGSAGALEGGTVAGYSGSPCSSRGAAPAEAVPDPNSVKGKVAAARERLSSVGE